jgi:hypothetical protein
MILTSSFAMVLQVFAITGTTVRHHRNPQAISTIQGKWAKILSLAN